jgi:hypothetical protein
MARVYVDASTDPTPGLGLDRPGATRGAGVVEHLTGSARRVAWSMRPTWHLVAIAALLGAARAATPTCAELVAALPHALATASEVVVAVTLEQGGREVAYERSRVARGPDGERTTTVLERRGLRRPEGPAGGAGGAFELPCDDHDLEVDASGHVRLTLRDPDPDAAVASWTLRFAPVAGVLRPASLIAPFAIRVLFVPIRGRFATEFTDWRFAPD